MRRIEIVAYTRSWRADFSHLDVKTKKNGIGEHNQPGTPPP
jgi:hypothetical protein